MSDAAVAERWVNTFQTEVLDSDELSDADVRDCGVGV
jgi:hypothetical protein